MNRGSCVQISNGTVFDPLDPDPGLITIDTIAHALANQCRFGGHTSRRYSVAEHCVHVSRLVPPPAAKKGLLHDASEFALGDMPSPLKNETELGALYRKYEAALQGTIEEKFGVTGTEYDAEIKRADEAMREIERLQLLPRTPEGDALWESWKPGADLSVPEYCWPQCWAPEVAKVLFIERFREVQHG